MGDNGELKTTQEKVRLGDGNLGKAGNSPEPPVQNLPPEQVPPVTDFKIGEIWIRSGQLMLDAPSEFWKDKFRARGVIAYLDDIIKQAKVPDDRPKIFPTKGSFLNGLRKLNLGRKR